MKVYLGSDHQGFVLKGKVAAYLAKRKLDYEDVGGKTLDPTDDFPQFAAAAALKVMGDMNHYSPDPKFRENQTAGESRAILICGSGQGMAIAANRFRGIRAIVASSADDASYGRSDDDANILCLPARLFDSPDEDAIWKNIVDTFLTTEFTAAPRFIRRNRMIDEIA
jgi:ribose 5-phosphate isomerase B